MIIAVCVPAIAVSGALNIVFRAPDLYAFEFTQSQVADEIDLGMSDEELGRFFSDFMRGKEDHFALFTEYRDREQAVFGAIEQSNMERVRRLLDMTFYVLGAAFFLIVLSCTFFLKRDWKRELRGAFKLGLLVQTAVLAGVFAVMNLEPQRVFFYQKLFPNQFGADDVLPLMLTKEFAQLGLAAVAVISFIFLTLLISVLWRLTKPRRMFW
jgi:hypothetical protein